MLPNMHPIRLNSHCNIYTVIYDKGNVIAVRDLLDFYCLPIKIQ